VILVAGWANRHGAPKRHRRLSQAPTIASAVAEATVRAEICQIRARSASDPRHSRRSYGCGRLTTNRNCKIDAKLPVFHRFGTI
jgi:hypothetical protein